MSILGKTAVETSQRESRSPLSYGSVHTSGADPGFFLGADALVSCSTSTPINHIVFFLQNTSCIRKPQVISGGVRTPCTLPLDPPLFPHPPRIRWTLSIRPPKDQKHLAVLTGDHINEGFFASYYVWQFCPAAKKSGRNNEVTVLPRWP